MKFLVYSMLSFVMLFSASECFALAVNTHRAINTYILDNSQSINERLKDYHLELGLITPLGESGKNARDCIVAGGELEDAPLRYANHYHNPLKSWDKSGYSLPGSVSTPMWIQQENQWTSLLTDDSRSWPDARSHFYTALTADNEDKRNNYFAACFTSVGQCMHLVEDMSVPAHVRDESHAKGNIYEIWVDTERKNNNLNYYLAPYTNSPATFTPDKSLLKVGPSAAAMIPVVGLLDADVYTGYNASMTTGAVGLAEYTNCNFFSEESVFSKESVFSDEYFFFPDETSVEEVQVSLSDGRIRSYYLKTQHGEHGPGAHNPAGHPDGYIIATVEYLRDYVTYKIEQLHSSDTRFLGLPIMDPAFRANIAARMNEKPSLDDYCYENYALKLIPRAVGYSKTLLDYFFRGSLEAVDAKSTRDASGAITSISTKVKNTTPDEGMAGGKLVVSYSYTPEGGGATVYGKSDERQLSGGIATGATSDSEYTFTFDDPIPADADEVNYLLVYRGQLGAEADAVAAKAFEADVIVIDDWENGQGWSTQDGRVTLSADDDAIEGSHSMKGVLLVGETILESDMPVFPLNTYNYFRVSLKISGSSHEFTCLRRSEVIK